MSFTFIELLIVLIYLLLLLISGLALFSIHATNRILYEIEMQKIKEVASDDLPQEEETEEEEETAKEEQEATNEEQEATNEEQEATKEELLQMIDSWKPLADSLKTE
jgi:flagellar biosynthesis component FlhA